MMLSVVFLDPVLFAFAGRCEAQDAGRLTLLPRRTTCSGGRPQVDFPRSPRVAIAVQLPLSPEVSMRASFLRSRVVLTAVALGAAIAGGLSCGGDSGPSKVTIADYIGAITAGTIAAVRQSGSPPAAGAGPTVTVTGNGTVIPGGSSQASVAGSAPFTDVFVAVDGVDGYYQLTLPAPVANEDILLTMAQRIPAQAFSLSYGLGATGSIGAYQAVPIAVVSVGTGEVQVSVSWNGKSDVDLHVVEPGGEEIYYGNPTSATGGTLDLDSNAGCAIDDVNNENITWANAPSGTYTVRVDYWDSCTVTQSDYVVTVQRKGQPVQTFSGSFTGAGDQGASGSGTEITTFTFP
jgi:hypothetical protein